MPDDLMQSTQEQETPFGTIPDYLVAADNHNVAANSWSLTDFIKGSGGAAIGGFLGSFVPIPGLGTLGGAAIGGAVGSSLALNQGKFIASSLVSGTASFYNTGVQVSNWFGNNAVPMDVQSTLTAYDSDLGAYYRNNQQSADLAGFFAGSLIPTVGALKLYNYVGGALGIAKAGAIGTNFSSATGLLGNIQANALKTAITEMGAAEGGMTLLNSNMLKAFAIGAADEAIGGAFASAATLATMHASPVLTQMDASDIAWNITEGALLGGAIGGLLRGAKVFGEARRGVAEYKDVATPYVYGESLPEGAPASHRILNSLNNLFNKPQVDAGLGEEQYKYAKRKRDESVRAIEDSIRTDFAELTSKDYTLSSKLADTVAIWGNILPAEEHLIGLKSVSRIPIKTAEEKAVESAQRNRRAARDSLSDADADALAYTQTTFLKLNGEGAGKVTAEAPTFRLLGFADRMAPGTEIKVSASGVEAPGIGSGSFKLSTDPKKKVNYVADSADSVEARNIWANSVDGPTMADGMQIHYDDLALLRRSYAQNKLPQIIAPDGSKLSVAGRDDLIGHIQDAVEVWKNRALEFNALEKPDSVNRITNPELAKRLDVTLGYLEQEAVNVNNPVRNLFAMRTAAEDYTAALVNSGRYSAVKPIIETYLQPQYAKLVSDTKPFRDVNNFVLEGMALVKEKARIQQIALDNAVANGVGVEAYSEMVEIGDRAAATAIREGGPGQGFLSSANKAYGSLGSAVQQIGAATHRLIKRFTDTTDNTLASAAYGMNTDANAALEWQALQQKLRSTGATYYHDYNTSSLKLNPKTAEKFPNLESEIVINNPIVNDAFKAHIARNSVRQTGKIGIQSAAGYASTRDPLAAYPIPVNQKRYPHFALVVDDSVAGTGRTSTIYAASAKELDDMIAKVQEMPEKFKVLRKDEIERNKTSLGIFSEDDAITDVSINDVLARRGVSSNFIPKTDPKSIVDDFISWHHDQDRSFARYAVSAKYSKHFDELNKLAEASTGVQTSRVGFSSLASYMEGKVQNPITDYIKMALDMPSTNEIPIWTAWNNVVDNKFTQIKKALDGVFSKTVDSKAAAEQANAIFDSVGIKHASYDAQLNLIANGTPNSGALNSFVSRSNAILTTLVLRADPMNALNNMFGSGVLTSAEFKNILRAVEGKDAATVGELAKITLPGTGDALLSVPKMWAKSAERFWTNPEAVQWARDHGFTTRNLLDAHSIVDDLTLSRANWAGDIGDLGSKYDRAYKTFMAMGDRLEKFTGNKFAEEFNRFVSADMMKQLTDLAVQQGIMTPKTALSYINTAVNRTQGIYIASQRPLMFQGALGQAVGLFQSYQFNMMQQLLRYVADGTSKTAAMALGMQGTIYGLHGLPGFDYINTHIIGTAAGNPTNRDLYDATYGIAGKQAGNWLMYGAASNLPSLLNSNLAANLYSRGDINPRQLTVVPINPANIPIIAGAARFYSSLKDSITRTANGGDVWSSVLQGIEHSGVNRPLAGLAQTMQAFGNPELQSYSTTSKGSIVASNDLWSLANLTRIAGAKPLDEAIGLDAGYRLDLYKATDLKRRAALGEALKTKLIARQELTSDDIEGFQSAYVAMGGKQQEFNQFMMDAMKGANTSHANKISSSLKSPHSQSMQTIMGPYDLRDFSSRY